MLENAMSVIFFHHFKTRSKARHLLVSAVMPYLFLLLIVLGIVMVSLAISAAESLTARLIPLFGWGVTMQGVSGTILYLTGLAGEFLVLSSIYLVLPAVRVSLHYALIGGLTATLLWEGARRLLVWYYSAISMVNLIYGPIAIAVGALLSVEVAAIIILVGAQVIAELQAGRDGDPLAGEIEM
jgi:YihY family inner membrane protein